LLLPRLEQAQAVAGIAGQVDALSNNDRTGSARPRQLDPPDDVLLLGPGDRQPLFLTRAGAARPAELAPISAERGERHQCCCKLKKTTMHEKVPFGGF